MHLYGYVNILVLSTGLQVEKEAPRTAHADLVTFWSAVRTFTHLEQPTGRNLRHIQRLHKKTELSQR